MEKRYLELEARMSGVEKINQQLAGIEAKGTKSADKVSKGVEDIGTSATKAAGGLHIMETTGNRLNRQLNNLVLTGAKWALGMGSIYAIGYRVNQFIGECISLSQKLHADSSLVKHLNASSAAIDEMKAAIGDMLIPTITWWRDVEGRTLAFLTGKWDEYANAKAAAMRIQLTDYQQRVSEYQAGMKEIEEQRGQALASLTSPFFITGPLKPIGGGQIPFSSGKTPAEINAHYDEQQKKLTRLQGFELPVKTGGGGGSGGGSLELTNRQQAARDLEKAINARLAREHFNLLFPKAGMPTGWLDMPSLPAFSIFNRGVEEKLPPGWGGRNLPYDITGLGFGRFDRIPKQGGTFADAFETAKALRAERGGKTGPSYGAISDIDEFALMSGMMGGAMSGGVRGAITGALPAIGMGLGGPWGAAAGALLGGLVDMFKRKKPSVVTEPIPVKVVNWDGLTQLLNITKGSLVGSSSRGIDRLNELRMRQVQVGG